MCDCIVVTRTANAVYSLAMYLLLVPWPMSHMPTTHSTIKRTIVPLIALKILHPIKKKSAFIACDQCGIAINACVSTSSDESIVSSALFVHCAHPLHTLVSIIPVNIIEAIAIFIAVAFCIIS